jgi:hypothetical protein
MPELFFTWIRRDDKRVHFEFLDNSVPRGEPPRTAAFGWNEVMNVLDVESLVNIERYRKVDIGARTPAALYRDAAALAPRDNVGFLAQCMTEFREVNFAQQDTGRIYLRVTKGAPEWMEDATISEQTRVTLGAVLPGLCSTPRAGPSPKYLADGERVHTVGTWKTR